MVLSYHVCVYLSSPLLLPRHIPSYQFEFPIRMGHAVRALSISQNWPAGPVVLNVKWAFCTRFSHKSTITVYNIYWLIWRDKSDSLWNSVLKYTGLAGQFWQMESTLILLKLPTRFNIQYTCWKKVPCRKKVIFAPFESFKKVYKTYKSPWLLKDNSLINFYHITCL